MEPKIRQIYDKAIRMVDGCKTPEQLFTANSYVRNFIRMYRGELNSLEYTHLVDTVRVSDIAISQIERNEMVLELSNAWNNL